MAPRANQSHAAEVVGAVAENQGVLSAPDKLWT